MLCVFVSTIQALVYCCTLLAHCCAVRRSIAVFSVPHGTAVPELSSRLSYTTSCIYVF